VENFSNGREVSVLELSIKRSVPLATSWFLKKGEENKVYKRKKAL